MSTIFKFLGKELSAFLEEKIMFNNIGTIDRIIRLILAIALFYVSLICLTAHHSPIAA